MDGCGTSPGKTHDCTSPRGVINVPTTAEPEQENRSSTSILSVEEVTVDFAGFKALEDLSLHIETNELRFLIGPNGAGKTTLLNVITGLVKPIRGRVTFQNEIDVLDHTVFELAQLGIGRKMQTPSIFHNFTVWENLAFPLDSDKHFWSLFQSLTRDEKERVSEVASAVGLDRQLEQDAGSLSHGEKQWLEIGIVLLQDPDLVLLDEPVSGMTHDEAMKTGELIEEIAEDRTVLVVEHDMHFVETFSRRVTVVHRGQVLSEGTFEEIQNDPRVVDTYLGES